VIPSTRDRTLEARKEWRFPRAIVADPTQRNEYSEPAFAVDARRKSPKQAPPKIGRAERNFLSHLNGVAEHVGHLISGFNPRDPGLVPTLLQLLRAYSDALKPWAVSTVKQMLGEVDARDRDSWRTLGTSISRQLKLDLLGAPVGGVLRDLMAEQVELIQSIPIEAGERVHKLMIKGLENSERAENYVEEIERSGKVTHSRAVLIARTEVARTAASLTQARALAAGVTHYRWQTAGDADVRPGHKVMQGRICEFAKPPAVKENGRIMYHNPGMIWNCRCWAEPLVEFKK
jgi:SPP1 gp7 family putative phage head morphogenesis protein